MTALCNLNGSIVAEDEARVPVLDRGFLFGDSVYEVFRTRAGVPFAWREHLDRLRASADGIGLEIDLDDRALMLRVKETLAAAGLAEAYIRLIVTRGTGTAPAIDLAYAPGPANYVILVRELPRIPESLELALIPRLRMDRRALDPAIKSGNYLNNLLGLADAKARGATECLFLNREGLVTEASTSNFYLVEGEAVYTPALSAGLLSGITRGLLLELCAEVGVKMEERALSAEDVRQADEMFLSSTLREIVPVTSVDGKPVGSGRPGPFTSKLSEQFEAFCDRRSAERDAPEYEAL